MGRYEGGRGLKWPKIGDVVYGWPLILCIFRTYYQCQANGAKRGGYEAILKHCAAGTAFDPKSGICNHVSSLSCEKEPSQSVDPFEYELRGTSKITNTEIAYKQLHTFFITYTDTYLIQDKYFSFLTQKTIQSVKNVEVISYCL